MQKDNNGTTEYFCYENAENNKSYKDIIFNVLKQNITNTNQLINEARGCFESKENISEYNEFDIFLKDIEAWCCFLRHTDFYATNLEKEIADSVSEALKMHFESKEGYFLNKMNHIEQLHEISLHECDTLKQAVDNILGIHRDVVKVVKTQCDFITTEFISGSNNSHGR